VINDENFRTFRNGTEIYIDRDKLDDPEQKNSIVNKYINALGRDDLTNDQNFNLGPYIWGDMDISGYTFSKLNNDIRLISFQDSNLKGTEPCYRMAYDTAPGASINDSNTIFLFHDPENEHFDLLLPNSSPFITYEQLIDALKNETIMNKELEITDTDGNITKTSTLELFKNSPPPPTDQLLIASIVNNTIGINKLPRYTRTIATQLYNFALQNNDNYETFIITLKNAIGQGSSNGGQSQKTQSKKGKKGNVGFTSTNTINSATGTATGTDTGAATSKNPQRVLLLKNLTRNKGPTDEKLWKDFNKFGPLEYTQREKDADIASVAFKEEKYTRDALGNFDPKTYGQKVELIFNRIQPPAYIEPVEPVEAKTPLYTQSSKKNTRDIYKRYTGTDTYVSPTNKPGSILNTIRTIAK
jgi:hypothetical protein